MKQFSGMRKPNLTITGLATGSLISLLLAAHQPSWGQQGASMLSRQSQPPLALAAMVKDYQPPANPTPPRRTTGGGTRGGCDGNAAMSLTALAPQIHIGQTASARPTLTWYIADETAAPIELQLYRYTSSDPQDRRLEPVDFFELGPSQSGWMTFTLPASLPPLEVGETYRWKVILQCSESQPSRNKIDEADLRVVPLPADGVVTGDPVQQAEHYAAAGLWYDAIATLAQAPDSPAVAAYRRELIASLAELEADNPNDRFSLFSDRLRYIVDQD